MTDVKFLVTETGTRVTVVYEGEEYPFEVTDVDISGYSCQLSPVRDEV